MTKDMYVAVSVEAAVEGCNDNIAESLLRRERDKRLATYAYEANGRSTMSINELKAALIKHNMDVKYGRTPDDPDNVEFIFNPMNQLDLFTLADRYGYKRVFFPEVGAHGTTPAWFWVDNDNAGRHSGYFAPCGETIYRRWFYGRVDAYRRALNGN